MTNLNLWAEFDNQHRSGETARGRGRRLTEQVMLSSMREWLLRDYVAAYCRALARTRIYRRCYWIDAWGGYPRAALASTTSALNGRTAQKQEGESLPILALQPVMTLAGELAGTQSPLTLYGLIMEGGSSGRSGFARARGKKSSQVEMPALPTGSGVVAANWLEAQERVLDAVEQSPAIFLLNPFERAAFRAEHLAPLYQRTTAPTDLLLALSHQQVAIHLSTAAASPTEAAALTALLKTDRWKTLTGDGRAEAASGLIRLFVAAMERHFLAVQPITVPVRVGLGHAEYAPLTLLFATRGKDSLASMNDAVCLHNRSLAARSHRGVLGEEWFEQQQEERRQAEWRELADRATHLGRSQRTRRWPDLRQQLLLASFGAWTIAEFDRVVLDLLAHGTARCQWQKSIAPGEERVPGHTDTLLWT